MIWIDQYEYNSQEYRIAGVLRLPSSSLDKLQHSKYLMISILFGFEESMLKINNKRFVIIAILLIVYNHVFV